MNRLDVLYLIASVLADCAELTEAGFVAKELLANGSGFSADERISAYGRT